MNLFDHVGASEGQEIVVALELLGVILKLLTYRKCETKEEEEEEEEGGGKRRRRKGEKRREN